MATANDLAIAVEEGREETTSDVLVKFLMSRNISVDVINDSNFQTLWKSVAQQGEQSLVFLENSTGVQKSLWKFEQEIKQYMRMVIESWKITGCSVMSYNLKGGLQKKCVLGFYSPKGFIFLEEGSSEENQKALADLVPYEPCVLNRVIQFVRHGSSYRSECQYQALDLTGAVQNSFSKADEIECIREQIHVLWRSICKTSEWVQTLIKKSDKIYELMVSSHLNQAFYNSLKRKGIEQVPGWKPISSFSRLGMVMKAKSELKAWISNISNIDAGVATIINNNEFWKDGDRLLKVLAPFFKIPTLMDTLVPSAGYLELAIDKAHGLLKTYSENEPLKYKQIWECFNIWRGYCTHSVQDLTFFLNPCYILRPDLQENINSLAPFLYAIVGVSEEEEEDEEEKGVLDAEIDAYCSESSNPFANVSISECEANHPITLWSKYGGGFPLLQKCAYRLLSQPACCLCKQVEKQVSKIHGSDNYLLRLNGLMMLEFTKMGDQIYQPIRI